MCLIPYEVLPLLLTYLVESSGVQSLSKDISYSGEICHRFVSHRLGHEISMLLWGTRHFDGPLLFECDLFRQKPILHDSLLLCTRFNSWLIGQVDQIVWIRFQIANFPVLTWNLLALALFNANTKLRMTVVFWKFLCLPRKALTKPGLGDLVF